jgi:hypothetical protein
MRTPDLLANLDPRHLTDHPLPHLLLERSLVHVSLYGPCETLYQECIGQRDVVRGEDEDDVGYA